MRHDRNVPLEYLKQLWDRVPSTAGRDLETIDLIWQRSSYVIHAWSNKQLVGTARVISDGAYFAFICDVVTAPRFEFLRIKLIQRASRPFLYRHFTLYCQSDHIARSPQIFFRI
ncbi:MAG: hypothetical protein C7B47_15245 [Sulfobacillus thermosulfidooxidans]|uniref:N-acetyltransferase domain-containing protein n=1 Tax=Sulfobacillus thermosulfidooxidans TaxID=28034 RepID=A0A2T2WPW3_SULTH|nr:MAG: hypothetical protein C7B47_15245 [Sulfobacillus thermosulfidooxidans]